MTRQKKPPRASRIELRRLTYESLLRTISAWYNVYSQPGAVFLNGSFHGAHTSNLVMGTLGTPTMDAAGVAMVLGHAVEVLSQAVMTKETATIDLGNASDEALDAFVWASANCRLNHGGQARALQRVGLAARKYLTRPPLMKLADCAE